MRFCALRWCEHIVEVCPGHPSAANHLLLVQLSQATIYKWLLYSKSYLFVRWWHLILAPVTLNHPLCIFCRIWCKQSYLFSLFRAISWLQHDWPKNLTWFHVSIFVTASWQTLLPKQWNVKNYYFYIPTLSWQVLQQLAQLAHCRPPSPQVVAAADLEQLLLHLLDRCFSPLVVRIHFCSKPLKIIASPPIWTLQKKIGK